MNVVVHFLNGLQFLAELTEVRKVTGCKGVRRQLHLLVDTPGKLIDIYTCPVLLFLYCP